MHTIRLVPIRSAAVPAISLALTLAAPVCVHAQARPPAPQSTSGSSSQADRRQAAELVINERIMVIGGAANAREIPGSAFFLDLRDLERQAQAFDDVHRILRQVPGVNIQDEEGFGLRPNIGLRGSGSERSQKITLMEDGVLIAPAPYAAPAAYYFPTAGRMRAIEVRKGSSQIKYGPRTNGGAVNLLSAPIPRDTFDVRARLAGGTHETARGLLDVGGSGENYGWLLETYQLTSNGFKELDGGGDTGYELQDYLFKAGLNTDASARVYQDLELKLGKTKQISDETYLGLTDEDFAADPLRRYAGSQQDVFRSDHEQYQVRHFAAFTPQIDLTTIAYRNDFARNWYKLDSINGTGIADVLGDPDEYAAELAIARGADSEADALTVRANNREYYGQGVQSVLGWRLTSGDASHQLEIGVRYHEDQEDRFQHDDGYRMSDGDMVLTSAGAPGSQANRVSDASALAFFAQDHVRWGSWSFIPGVRVESIDLVRTDYATSDPQRLSPTRVRTNDLTVVVPGVGVSHDFSNELQLFAGVHEGFAPPGPGSNEFTDAEQSINYEVGTRYLRGPAALDFTFFFNDYSNLLGADTLASGGSGSGDLFNGGEVNVVGFEASSRIELGRIGETGVVPVRVGYTFTRGTFQDSFSSDYEPWGDVEEGDRLPYLPEHQLAAGVGLQQQRWTVDLQAIYSSAMRTEASQGPIDPRQATDAFLVWNLTFDVTLAEQVGVFVGVENLTDSVYIVARRPAGVRPGLPRTLVVGTQLDF